jgi:DNA-binding response OmpR family regulator
MRILVIEDTKRIALAIKEGLEQESYAVDVAYDGEEGRNAALHEPYDLIILDLLLPSIDGITVCRELRSANITAPILMLTAKNQEYDIVNGLDAGADDYLAKPFSFDVLLARMRALLRRPHNTTKEVLSIGDLELELSTHKVTRAGHGIELSRKEYALLEYLLRNAGKACSKESIISHVWDFDADILPNTLEVFIVYLRAKIDKPFSYPLIHTVRGFGYRMSEEP